MAARVGIAIDPERLAAMFRRIQISGAVIGVVLIVGSIALATVDGGFEWTSYNETRQGETALSYPATGVLFGVVFLFFPLAFGFVMRTAVGEQLYLNGTELTVVKPGKREPDVFDLTRTRAQVRLDAPTGANAGRSDASGKAGGEVGAYRPVLVLFRESDGRESIIELANQRTRHMRTNQEILMLEGAMRLAADPAIQHAAGQLRTVARWAKLPVIYETSPDAIPATPADAPSSQARQTPVASGIPAPEIEILHSNHTRPEAR